MTDERKDFQARAGELYQAYGLNGRFAESFDLDDLRRLFEAKYGYRAKVAVVIAGGSTALVGPINGKLKDG